MEDYSKKRKADDNGTSASQLQNHRQLTPADYRTILGSFTKDQLIEVIQSAAVRHPDDVISAVRSAADSDPAKRKLFVRGLGWDTTSDDLRAAFSPFGDISDVIVVTDKATGKSKGFGFVVYEHVDGAYVALKQPSKKINGRMTVAQLASAGVSNADVSTRKLYVGNIPFEISADRLLGYFSSFGEVEEGPLGFESSTGKPRGFAFFIYKTEEGARASLVEPTKNIDGHQVICKLAIDGKKGKPGVQNGGGDVGTGTGTGLITPSFGGTNHQNPYMYNPTPNAMGGTGPGYQAPPPSYTGSVGYGAGLGGYGGLQYGGPSSMHGLPASADNGGYGSAHTSQTNQPFPGPRVPLGGAYHGRPPYY